MYLNSLIKSNGKLLMEEFSSFSIYIFFWNNWYIECKFYSIKIRMCLKNKIERNWYFNLKR